MLMHEGFTLTVPSVSVQAKRDLLQTLADVDREYKEMLKKYKKEVSVADPFEFFCSYSLVHGHFLALCFHGLVSRLHRWPSARSFTTTWSMLVVPFASSVVSGSSFQKLFQFRSPPDLSPIL